MPAIVTAILLCLFNVIMWVAVLIRFKNVFSTDEILNRAKEELNSVLREINANTDRNITLVAEARRSLREETSEVEKRLKELTSEAERRLLTLEREIKQAEENKVFQEKITAISSGALLPEQKYIREQQKSKKTPTKSANTKKSDAPKKSQNQDDPVSKAKEELVITKDYKEQVKELSLHGMTVEEIASTLGRSTQEVKFTLEFS